MSSCLSEQQREEEIKKMTETRVKALKKDIRKYLLNMCVKDVLVDTGLGGHIDAALHLDRRKLLVEALREVANDLEKA